MLGNVLQNPFSGKCFSGAGVAVLIIAALPSTANAQWRNVWRTQTDSGQAQEEVDFNMKIDHDGNSVTVGWVYTSDNGYDLLLRKYDRTGRLLWTANYDGSAHGDEYFGSISLDSSNNIIVVGTSESAGAGTDIATLKYDPDGQLLWAQNYDGPLSGRDESYGWPAVGLDADENIYVCGYSQAADGVYEAVTIKYDPDGNQQWVQRYRGASQNYPNSYGYALGVTSAGDVYFGVSAWNVNDDEDYVIVKYDTDGNLLWDRYYDSDYHGGDSLYTISIDSAENVYVTGISDSAFLNNDFEYCAASFDSDGNFRWAGRYGGNYGFHYGWIIEPDEAGGAYVSGASMTTGGEYDIVTVRFNSNGSTAWAQRFRDNRYFGDDWAYLLKRDADGNLLVAGYIWSGFARSNDACLLKYSPGGQLLDSIVYDAPAHGDDRYFACDVDDAGRVVAAGFALGNRTGVDSHVAKYTIAPPAQLTIDPDPLVAGQNATVTLENVEPDSRCYLAYSLVGPGSVYVQFLNVNLLMQQPRQVGPVVTSDASGTAVWHFHIPGNMSGVNLWLQAAQYNQASNLIATQVQ